MRNGSICIPCMFILNSRLLSCNNFNPWTEYSPDPRWQNSHRRYGQGAERSCGLAIIVRSVNKMIACFMQASSRAFCSNGRYRGRPPPQSLILFLNERLADTSNHLFELATRFVHQTTATFFFTGRAGTGKTTFCAASASRGFKKMAVIALHRCSAYQCRR